MVIAESRQSNEIPDWRSASLTVGTKIMIRYHL
jgi:hypothetical protein